MISLKGFAFSLLLSYLVLIIILSNTGGTKDVSPVFTNQFELEQHHLLSKYGVVENDKTPEVVKVVDVPKQETKKYYDIPLSHDLQDYISSLCKEYEVDEDLAYAVMTVETGGTYNPKLISSTNDYGLFQVNRVNFKWLQNDLGITDFLDPWQNSKAGIYMLSTLTKKYDDKNRILTAYNRGENGMVSLVSRSGSAVSDYSRKVLNAMPAFNIPN